MYLVFTSDSNRTAWDRFYDVCDYLNARLGYPSTDRTILTYTAPIHHPNENDYRVAMMIEDRCVQWLTPEQMAALQTLEQLTADGWFAVGGYHP